ncbi:MAG: GNAT family N-acetyltransferase [Deltaproteobacteria bacterium]|nr:GNAT family N-acetyltransferase [Deltaproteobacteria bacterium]
MISKLRTITDLAEAEAQWRAHIPPETIFDLWEVRMAFHRHFGRPLRFLAGNTENNKFFLPLSWVEEKGAWCFFPGETWSNKTWLEQNRLYCEYIDKESLTSELGSDFHLGFVRSAPDSLPVLEVDEIGYLFFPHCYRYDMENWWADLGHKHAKNLHREITAFKRRGIQIHQGCEKHFDLMVEMNLTRFGETSYFADSRFREGFRDMLAVLFRKRLLRVVVLEVDGTPAAVDFGSVYQGRYTLLAGGTDVRLPGVAKLINLHHMEWACAARLDEVDFLCGDFSWKRLFHLTARPQYLFTSMA